MQACMHASIHPSIHQLLWSRKRCERQPFFLLPSEGHFFTWSPHFLTPSLHISPNCHFLHPHFHQPNPEHYSPCFSWNNGYPPPLTTCSVLIEHRPSLWLSVFVLIFPKHQLGHLTVVFQAFTFKTNPNTSARCKLVICVLHYFPLLHSPQQAPPSAPMSDHSIFHFPFCLFQPSMTFNFFTFP